MLAHLDILKFMGWTMAISGLVGMALGSILMDSSQIYNSLTNVGIALLLLLLIDVIEALQGEGGEA
jgi:hypothetical protein